MKKLTSLFVIAIAMVIAITTGCGNSSNNNQEADDTRVTDNTRAADSLALLEKHRADSTRVADSLAKLTLEEGYAKTEALLNQMDLTKIGFDTIKWDGQKVESATKVFKGNNTLSGVHYAITEATSEGMYEAVKTCFSEAPTLWLIVLKVVKPVVDEFRTMFTLPFIDESIVPYLEAKDYNDGYKPAYNSFYEAFYKIQIAEGSGVWTHPKWEQFEKDFFVKFPSAFGRTVGSALSIQLSSTLFGNSYKYWLQANKRIPLSARASLAQAMKLYNK